MLVATARTRHRWDAGDALAEAGQAVQCAGAVLGIQRAVGAQASGHTHAVAQAVDHAWLTVFHARHHHVEAVGAHVDGGHQLAILDLHLVAEAHRNALIHFA